MRFAPFAVAAIASLATQAAHAGGDERFHASIGVSPLSYYSYGVDGHYEEKDEHFLQAEVGWAHRLGGHFELGAAYDVELMSARRLTLHWLPLSVRGFVTPTEDVEIGLAARGGVLFGRQTFPRSEAASFFGWAVGPAIDVRRWIGPRFGLLFAVDGWLARANVSGVTDTYAREPMIAISFPTVSVGALLRL